MKARFSRIRTSIANIKILSHEPIALVGLGMEALFLYQEARAGGVGIEDAAIAAVIGILTALGRQLVYPAAKVDAATEALKPVAAKLERPYTGADFGEPS